VRHYDPSMAKTTVQSEKATELFASLMKECGYRDQHEFVRVLELATRRLLDKNTEGDVIGEHDWFDALLKLEIPDGAQA
jgi:hypothetical protein